MFRPFYFLDSRNSLKQLMRPAGLHPAGSIDKNPQGAALEPPRYNLLDFRLQWHPGPRPSKGLRRLISDLSFDSTERLHFVSVKFSSIGSAHKARNQAGKI